MIMLGSVCCWDFPHYPKHFFHEKNRLQLQSSAIVTSLLAYTTVKSTPAKANVVMKEKINSDTLSIFVPGYLLNNQNYYSSFEQDVSSVVEDFIFVDTPSITSGDLDDSSNELIQLIETQWATNQYQDLLLIGHSRGGAVLTMVLQKLSAAHNNNKEAIPIRNVNLCLIDPVDDAALDSLQAKSIPGPTGRDVQGTVYPNFATNSNNMQRLLKSVLLLSTPYGGYSKYYDTALASACSPKGRDSQSFYEYFKGITNNVELVTFNALGHMQILEEGYQKIRSITQFCASNDDAVAVSAQYEALHARVRNWTKSKVRINDKSSRSKKKAESDTMLASSPTSSIKSIEDLLDSSDIQEIRKLTQYSLNVVNKALFRYYR
jgi:hypothetical protein